MHILVSTVLSINKFVPNLNQTLYYRIYRTVGGSLGAQAAMLQAPLGVCFTVAGQAGHIGPCFAPRTYTS